MDAMSVGLRWCCLVYMVLAAGMCCASAEEARTLGILSVTSGACSEIADEVFAKLADDGPVPLVERERFDAVAREAELALSGLAARDRAETGRLVGADVLALFADEVTPAGSAVCLVLCDCPTGARIGQLRIPVEMAGRRDAFVKEIYATLARFPAGVDSIVAVSDFLSRDLLFDYAHLQTDLAELLRQTLLSRHGIAVVGVAEAQAIAAEIERSGRNVRRARSLFVEGEYRTDPRAEGGPRISISAQIHPVHGERVALASGTIPLADAGTFIVERLIASLVELAGTDPGTARGPDDEFDRLVKRAAEFVEIGEFDRAAALREAALLLRPEAASERVQLVQDYMARNGLPSGGRPRTFKGVDVARQFSSSRARRCVGYARRTLQHVEYLVRNRQVTLRAGTRLFGRAISCMHGLNGFVRHGGAEECLPHNELLKKDFVRHVGPALLRLDCAPDRNARHRAEFLHSAAYQTFYHAFQRIDEAPRSADELALVGDLLCKVLPTDTPAMWNILAWLREGPRVLPDAERDVALKTWQAFVDRIGSSRQPLLQAYGQYARLCDRRYRLGEVSKLLLADMEALREALNAEELKVLDSRGDFRGKVSEEIANIERALRPEPRPAARRGAKGPSLRVSADGAIRCERVLLHPIDARIVLKDGSTKLLSEHHWRAGGGYSGWRGLVPAWEGTDVVYAGGALMYLDRTGQAREVLVDRKLSIDSVVFDGRYLWAAAGYSHGVYVLDSQGTTVAHATAVHGLPDAYVRMPLHPLSEGRVMAAGSFRYGGRGWLATIRLGPTGPHVNVFHEAVKTWPRSKETLQDLLDPALRFTPPWITEHRDQTGKRWAFVGRPHAPLMVDLDSLEVRVYPLRGRFDGGVFPRGESACAFLSHAGLLYVADTSYDFRVGRLDPQTCRFEEVRTREGSWLSHGGCLARFGDWLYYVSSHRWVRYNLETGQEECLVRSHLSLPKPRYGGPGWHIAVSRCFGLVAWQRGELFRVSVER